MTHQPLLTEQEQIDRELDEWKITETLKKQQPKFSEAQWLVIFEEAKTRWGRIIIISLKIRKFILEGRLEYIKWLTNWRLRTNSPETIWRDEIILNYGRKEIAEIQKEIERVRHEIWLVKGIGKKAKENERQKITPDMIRRAKESPIDRLVEINRAGFTQCFAHDDKKPSAYCKNNFIHCFVCQKHWDTIDVLMERDGKTFQEAVLYLQ